MLLNRKKTKNTIFFKNNNFKINSFSVNITPKSTCCAIIKKGPRKGQICGYLVKKKQALYCGLHYRFSLTAPKNKKERLIKNVGTSLEHHIIGYLQSLTVEKKTILFFGKVVTVEKGVQNMQKFDVVVNQCLKLSIKAFTGASPSVINGTPRESFMNNEFLCKKSNDIVVLDAFLERSSKSKIKQVQQNLKDLIGVNQTELTLWYRIIYHFLFRGAGIQICEKKDQVTHITIFVSQWDYYLFERSEFPIFFTLILPYLNHSIRSFASERSKKKAVNLVWGGALCLRINNNKELKKVLKTEYFSNLRSLKS